MLLLEIRIVVTHKCYLVKARDLTNARYFPTEAFKSTTSPSLNAVLLEPTSGFTNKTGFLYPTSTYPHDRLTEQRLLLACDAAFYNFINIYSSLFRRIAIDTHLVLIKTHFQHVSCAGLEVTIR